MEALPLSALSCSRRTRAATTPANKDRSGDGDGEATATATERAPRPSRCSRPTWPALLARGRRCGATGKCAKELTGGMLPSCSAASCRPRRLYDDPGRLLLGHLQDGRRLRRWRRLLRHPPSTLSPASSAVAAARTGLTGECRKKCTADTDCRRTTNARRSTSNALRRFPALARARALIGARIPKTCQPVVTPVKIDDNTVGKACIVDAECGPGTCAGYQAAPGRRSPHSRLVHLRLRRGHGQHCAATPKASAATSSTARAAPALKSAARPATASCRTPPAPTRCAPPARLRSPKSDAGTGDAGTDASALDLMIRA